MTTIGKIPRAATGLLGSVYDKPLLLLKKLTG